MRSPKPNYYQNYRDWEPSQIDDEGALKKLNHLKESSHRSYANHLRINRSQLVDELSRISMESECIGHVLNERKIRQKWLFDARHYIEEGRDRYYEEDLSRYESMSDAALSRESTKIERKRSAIFRRFLTINNKLATVERHIALRAA